MIQIIKGTFGYYNGRKVIPITNADGPQTFDPELEARLVKQGVAEYVQQETAGEQTGEELPEYSEDMKLDELKEIAAAYGVDASAMRKKSDVIKAIEAAKEATGEQTGDANDEEPPHFDAADPV